MVKVVNEQKDDFKWKDYYYKGFINVCVQGITSGVVWRFVQEQWEVRLLRWGWGCVVESFECQDRKLCFIWQFQVGKFLSRLELGLYIYFNNILRQEE